MSTQSYYDDIQARIKDLQQQVQIVLESEKLEQVNCMGNLEVCFQSLCEETSTKQRLLTAYERRKVNVSLNELQEAIQRVKGKWKPQYKLCWNSSGRDSSVPRDTQKKPEEPASLPSAKQIETVCDESALLTVENRTDETINVTDLLVNAEKRRLDVRFLQCDHSCFYLNSWTRDCQIKGLRNCKVMLGPVQTAAYIQQCTNCVICVAAQQIRIHDCQSCIFRVQSKQGSTLERCHDIVFGPYDYQYLGIEDDFQKVGLSCEKDSWKKVRDFQFLLNQKHWRFLTQDEQ